MVGWGCCEVPNASSIVACSVSRTPSEATSFASGGAVRRGRKTASSITMLTTHHEDVGEGDRKRGGEREAELAGSERPEGEAGEHGDRARRQVDEAGAPVRDDDADRDGGDRRPGPEAEQEEEEGLFHVIPCLVSRRGRSRPAPSAAEVVARPSLLGRPDPAGRLRLNCELALVGERLEHVVADARRGLVLAALELRAGRARAAP